MVIWIIMQKLFLYVKLQWKQKIEQWKANVNANLFN